jgi:uncharacterized protein (TIRG00374 family)
MTRSIRAWVRPLGGAAILAILLWQLGTGPFLHGVRMIDGWALLAASGLGALTIVCCAWRWSLVARGLGVRLPLRSAVAHCYRSVFLNVTLPGGVVGDVHRAVRHGQDVGDVSRGVRAVVWERAAGQVIQIAIAVVLLFALPSPVRPYLPVVTAVLAGCALAAVLLAWVLPGRTRSAGPGRERSGLPGGERSALLGRVRSALRTARGDLRDGVLARRAWPGVVLASVVCVLAHLATFVLAARTAGATAPLPRLVPLALLALLAMSLPLNIGGWGAREGVAAWAFGAAGLTVSQGVATAVVYGALVFVSSLPGAVVLLMPWINRVRRVPVPAPRVSTPIPRGPAPVPRESAAGG